MNLTEKLHKIEELQRQINGHGPLSAALQKRINYKFRLDWNYYSNAMEGGTLTKEETRSVMVGNITVDGKPLRDVIEMNGHDEIVREILNLGRGNSRLSESRIKAIHRAIMYEEEEAKKKLIGHWKKEHNQIINYRGEKFDFTSPNDVPEQIHELLNKTNAALDAIAGKKKKSATEPAPLIAFQFHLTYVTIHPFYDGNGRTARILMNLLLIAAGFPPIVIRTEEKERYYRYLADIQCYGGAPDLFFGFMADLLIRSQQLVLSAIAGQDIEEPDDWEKELELLKQQTKDDNKVQQKSEALLDQRFQDSFLPLIEKTKQKLSRFDDRFAVTNSQLHLFSSQSFPSESTLVQRIEELTKRGQLRELSELQLHLHWRGYTGDGVHTFNMSALININLTDEFRFSIKGNDSSIIPIEQLYTTPLTPAQIDQFANQQGKAMLTRMQQRIRDEVE